MRGGELVWWFFVVLCFIIIVIPSGLQQIPLGIKNLVHALIHVVIQRAFLEALFSQATTGHVKA